MKMSDADFITEQYIITEKGYGTFFVCGDPIKCGTCLGPWNYAHELPYIEEIKKMLGCNCIGIDVGAHIGTYSMALQDHVSQMYSFEPQFRSFCALLKNSTKYPNIIPIYGACGKLANENINCEVVNLGEFIETPVDFIKIDIEGQELFVLQDLAPVIRGYKDLVMLIEFEPQHYLEYGYDYKDFFGALADCGLDCTHFMETTVTPGFSIRDFCNILIQKVNGEVTAKTLNYIKR